MQAKVFFTAGPAQLYPTFEHHLQTAVREQIGSISHRSKQFKAIYQHTAEQLRTLLQIPATSQLLFMGTATDVWERAIQNGVEKETFHFVNGAFSKKFYDFAVELGKKAHKLEAPFGEGFDVRSVSILETVELVALTHNETSSGVSMPVADIHHLKKQHPDKLFVVDMVSSAPYPALDLSLIDSAFFSVQKGFGLPAGLGVWIANEAFLQKAEALKQKGQYIGTHQSLPTLWKNAANWETPSTPNVLTIYLLGKIAEDMNKQGIANIRKETDEKATLLYNFLEKSELLSPAVQNPAHRSATVAVANVQGTAAEVIEKMKGKGLIIGSGYGNFKDRQIRISNFPANTQVHIETLIEALKGI